MIYSIVNPSDEVTIEAPDVKLAQVAIMLVGEGTYGLKTAEGKEVLPLLFVCNEDQINEWMGEAIDFPLSKLGEYVDDNRIALAEVYESALVCGTEERAGVVAKLLERADHAMPKYIALATAWNEQHRSSVNDICGACYTCARMLREKAAAADQAPAG